MFKSASEMARLKRERRARRNMKHMLNEIIRWKGKCGIGAKCTNICAGMDSCPIYKECKALRYNVNEFAEKRIELAKKKLLEICTEELLV